MEAVRAVSEKPVSTRYMCGVNRVGPRIDLAALEVGVFAH
jgi:hypothetical protein